VDVQESDFIFFPNDIKVFGHILASKSCFQSLKNTHYSAELVTSQFSVNTHSVQPLKSHHVKLRYLFQPNLLKKLS